MNTNLKKCKNCGCRTEEIENEVCDSCWWELYGPTKEEVLTDFDEEEDDD